MHSSHQENWYRIVHAGVHYSYEINSNDTRRYDSEWHDIQSRTPHDVFSDIQSPLKWQQQQWLQVYSVGAIFKTSEKKYII